MDAQQDHDVIQLATLLVDVINEDLTTDDRVIVLDVLDWLSRCGLTLTTSDENVASQAYVALIAELAGND